MKILVSVDSNCKRMVVCQATTESLSLPLPATIHPTNANEFLAIYATSVFDVLSSNRRKIVLSWRKHALYIQRDAISLTLKEIGYFHDPDKGVWVYRQAGYYGSIADSLLDMPVANVAEKVANLGIDMLNERCRENV